MDIESVTVGDILFTTDDSGYDKLMLVTYVGPVTSVVGGRMATYRGVCGPLFDSWHVVNTPSGQLNVPAIQVGPSGWVTREPSDISGRMEWVDNPINPEWGNE